MSTRYRRPRRRRRFNWGVINTRCGDVMKRCRTRREAEQFVSDWDERYLGFRFERPAVRNRIRQFERKSQ